MALSGDEFLRLESLIYRPVPTRPDWLKAWRPEADYLLYLARYAGDVDDVERLEELEKQARETGRRLPSAPETATGPSSRVRARPFGLGLTTAEPRSRP